eukprot:Nk52_evm33s62 gene=Nk52_evmTU33s62
MSDSLKSVPEIFEQNYEECLEARTRAIGGFDNMGPPDLCHIRKNLDQSSALIKAKVTELGSYHYVYGLDTSTPASIAAYFNSLYYAQGKGSWKLQSGTYCCYNAFTRTDVRVEVTMPGSVNTYAIDQNGQRYKTDERTWHEVTICAVIRAKNPPSPFKFHIDCLRKFDPLSSLNMEASFLSSAKLLFWEGKYLGTTDLTVPANNVNNRLARTLEDHFLKGCRFPQMIDFFSQFTDIDPEVSYLVAKAKFYLDAPAKALCTLATSLQHQPLSAYMLILESDILRHSSISHAVKIAKLAVDVAPAQSLPWLNLAKMYSHSKQYSQALVALNVAPMAQGTQFILPEMPEPLRMMNNNEAVLNLVLEEEEGDEGLLALPGQNLKGTFADAYAIIAHINRDVGWDQLLASRSTVFVMEEEFTVAVANSREGLNSTSEKGRSSDGGKLEDHNAMMKSAEKAAEKIRDSYDHNYENGDVNRSVEEYSQSTNGNESSPKAESKEQKKLSGNFNERTKALNTLENDSRAESSTSLGGSGENVINSIMKKSASQGKRLCERWLDYLFTALYQDLKYYAIWVAQEQHAARTNQTLPLTVGDWLRFGALAERLHKKEDAYRAYRSCVDIRFSLRAWLALMKLYSQDGFVEETFEAVDQICKFFKRNPTLEIPSEVKDSVWYLVSKHGLEMVLQTGGALSKENPVINRYLQEAKTWSVYGWESSS